MHSQLFSSTLNGLDAHLVRVEVAVSNGLPGLTIVGLPDTAVSEAGARVRSALKAIGAVLPPRRIVVNLAPADLRKQGSGFDLALALGLLSHLGEVEDRGLESTLVVGELSLDGAVRPVKGVINSLALALKDPRVQRLILPACQAQTLPEAEGVDIFGVRHLAELRGGTLGKQLTARSTKPSLPSAPNRTVRNLAEVVGQPMARLALEVAAAGGHHLMMVGPPGCGKSLLASCLPGLLPPLTGEQWWEVAQVSSACGAELPGQDPPFRSPGPGTTPVALLGGYAPGEVTRAHAGVLFLDEFPEFRRDSLEALRQVLEEGVVEVARARFRVRYPARFTLIAAMNPCPCGHSTPGGELCGCSPRDVARYAHRFSGPMRDRFDLLVRLERARLDRYLGQVQEGEEDSDLVRGRVLKARRRQERRGQLNRSLRGEKLRQALRLGTELEQYCTAVGERFRLSVRGLEKWLRVARTLADLADLDRVTKPDLQRALALRDRGLEAQRPTSGDDSGLASALGAGS